VDSLRTLSVMDRIIFLRRVPLFANIAPADLQLIAGIAQERLFAAGEVIARQGDTGEELYIIVSGGIRVLARTGGEEVELAVRRSGDYVGEMSILTQNPRMASLLAVEETRVLSIDNERFELLLRERPDTSLRVIRDLCERLAAARPAEPATLSS
jgi:CRP-like cAMP-binding protein